MPTVYINGTYYREGEAKLSILDLGVLRGYGVFDYLRTYHGRPFHLAEHLLRLQFSAEHIGISLPLSLEQIGEIVLSLLQKKTWEGESSIKMIVTGGTSSDHFFPDGEPSVIVHAYPLKSFPATCYTEGVEVTTTHHLRSLPMSKTLHYTPGIMALKARPAREVLYVTTQGEILEASTSNFFVFKEGALVTPESEQILFGITREIVLRLSKNLYPSHIAPVFLEELGQWEEAFLTSSTKEVLPVVAVNGHLIGNGRVGPKTEKLMQAFHSYTQEETWPPLMIPRYMKDSP